MERVLNKKFLSRIIIGIYCTGITVISIISTWIVIPPFIIFALLGLKYKNPWWLTGPFMIIALCKVISFYIITKEILFPNVYDILAIDFLTSTINLKYILFFLVIMILFVGYFFKKSGVPIIALYLLVVIGGNCVNLFNMGNIINKIDSNNPHILNTPITSVSSYEILSEISFTVDEIISQNKYTLFASDINEIYATHSGSCKERTILFASLVLKMSAKKQYTWIIKSHFHVFVAGNYNNLYYIYYSIDDNKEENISSLLVIDSAKNLQQAIYSITYWGKTLLIISDCNGKLISDISELK